MRLRPALATLAIAALAACGSVDEPGTDATEGGDAAGEELTSTDGGTESVTIDVPDGWEETETEGFEYHYVSPENYWDDILAQRVEGPYPDLDPDIFITVLETNLPTSTGLDDFEITHRGDTTIDGYPGIIIDATYGGASSISSFTYVDTGDYLWEFTVNAQTPEGLAAGEAINATARFSE